jgi:hypothetical protein
MIRLLAAELLPFPLPQSQYSVEPVRAYSLL